LLVGIVSHDLRNPLQAIRLNAGLGLRGVEPGTPIARRLERIVASSERAARMIDDLLDLTRVRETGGLPVDPKLVNLHELTSKMVGEVLDTRPERQVAHDIQGDGWGVWDADRLAQVIQNLVANALQHTTEDTPVCVTTRGEDRYVVLEVHNGGPPIPQEELATLFEPFKRTQRKRHGAHSGLGLGLYITALIVAAHGGSVDVRSNHEQGTTFAVRLPRGNAHPHVRGNSP
jgi:signal transduction histidine kinase